MAVQWQATRLREELPDQLRDNLQEYSGTQADELLTELRDFPLLPGAAWTFKANVLPARTWDFCRRIADREAVFHAHAGNGIVIGHSPADRPERTKVVLDELIRTAADFAGNVVVLRCPSEWKSVVPVWGRSTPDRVLMRAVKDKLDPHRVFNPGRFVDGI